MSIYFTLFSQSKTGEPYESKGSRTVREDSYRLKFFFQKIMSWVSDLTNFTRIWYD